VHGAQAQGLENENVQGSDVQVASGHGGAPAEGVAIPK
jgi:hypothetical protein